MLCHQQLPDSPAASLQDVLTAFQLIVHQGRPAAIAAALQLLRALLHNFEDRFASIESPLLAACTRVAVGGGVGGASGNAGHPAAAAAARVLADQARADPFGCTLAARQWCGFGQICGVAVSACGGKPLEDLEAAAVEIVRLDAVRLEVRITSCGCCRGGQGPAAECAEFYCGVVQLARQAFAKLLLCPHSKPT